MAFSRQPVAHLDRRRELAQQIVDRYTDVQREVAWKMYIDRLRMRGKAKLAYLKMQGSLPEQLAERLEPGELGRMLEADQVEITSCPS